MSSTTLPVAPGHPLIGGLLPMWRDPIRHLVDSYLQKGPVFRLNVLNRSFVVMAGTEANDFMVRRERDYLQTGPIFGGFGTELGGELFLSSSDGDRHKQLRRIQTRSYSPLHLETRVPEVITGMRRRLGALEVGQRLDVQRLFQLVLAEQVGLLMHNHAELAHILDDLIVVFRTALLVTVMRQWPPAALHWPAYRRSRQRILDHAAKVAQWHRDHPSEARNDLVDDILGAVTRGDLVREENVRLLTLGPLFGGIDTASNTSAFALYNILARPNVRQRVMAEVDALFAEGPVPAWERFDDMPALHGVIMETLRLYPVAYLASRYVAKDFEFAGHRVKAGEQLFVATAVPHFLGEFFPRPYEFDIDRYGPDRREHARAGAFAPFGAGAHSCLGARFARSQLKLTLATLLNIAEFEIDPPDYELRVKSNPVTMPDGFAVRVTGVRRHADFPPEPWPAFSVDARSRLGRLFGR
jgi:cytochrome P450